MWASNVAQVAQVAQVTQVAQVAQGTQGAQAAQTAKVAQVAQVAQVGQAAQDAQESNPVSVNQAKKTIKNYGREQDPIICLKCSKVACGTTYSSLLLVSCSDLKEIWS